MEWPIVAPAPLVTEHAVVFRELFENPCQFRHVQHNLTGLLVLPNKRLATMARGSLDSADHTNLSRVLSEAPWREDVVNHRRIRFRLQQTPPTGIAAASHSSSSMIRCATIGAVSLTTWTGLTTIATAPIPWPTTRSPACLSVGRCAVPWACVCLGAMRH